MTRLSHLVSHLVARRLIAFSPDDAGATPAATAAPAAPVAPVADPPAAPAPVVDPGAAPAPAAAPVVVDPPTPKPAPAAITLTLPKDSTLPPDVVERTAAIASELGLSQDHAQRTLEFFNQEAAAHADRALAAALEAHRPGGAAWETQNTAWRDAALADPDLGNGNPAQLTTAVDLGKRVLATFFPADAIKFLEETGLGSSPATLKGLVKIGRMMREDQLILPTREVPAPPSAASVLYGGTSAAK